MEVFFVEGLAAPEEKADAILQLAVANDWVAVEEPDGMSMPDFVFGFGEAFVDLLREQIADGLVGGIEGGVVFGGVGVHEADSMKVCFGLLACSRFRRSQ